MTSQHPEAPRLDDCAGNIRIEDPGVPPVSRDYRGMVIRLQDNFGLVVARIGSRPWWTPERIKRHVLARTVWRWQKPTGAVMSHDLHYGDHGVAGGFPHAAEDCATTTQWRCPAHGRVEHAWYPPQARPLASPLCPVGVPTCGKLLGRATYTADGRFVGFVPSNG